MTAGQGIARDIIGAFREAMAAGDVAYSGPIEADGKLHRIRVEGDAKHRRNGWYVLHLDNKPSGAFGCLKRGVKTKWSAEGVKELTREERRALRAKVEADKKVREERDRITRETAAKHAVAIWQRSAEVAGHPYLTRKGVQAFGLRTGDWVKERIDGHGEVHETRIAGALLIPIRKSRDEIVSLQAIFPNDLNPLKRDKDFLAGGEKAGCYFTIGAPVAVDGKPVVVICEGYATGASIHQATGHAVVVAFDCENLLPVAQRLRAAMPAATIIIAADNDQWTLKPVKNPGAMRAIEAAAAVEGVAVLPRFAALDSKPTDFNDLHKAEGLDIVRAQVLAPLVPVPVEPEPIYENPHNPEIYEKPYEPAESASANNPQMSASDDTAKVTDAHDPDGYFTILGHDHDRIYVFSHEKKLISSRGEADWPEAALTSIAPAYWWEMEFAGDKGMNRKMAVNWLQRTAYRKGFFDPSIRRGRGAWRDEGRAVYHFGNALSVDGVMMPVTAIDSKFVYEQSFSLPLPSAEPLDDATGKTIFEIAQRFRWVRPESAILLAGWTALAPIGGALQWRPHIWITGPAGCGKSTIMKDFVSILMNGTGVFAQGNSTEAGIRQELKADSLPVLFDESEQNEEREVQRIQNVLSLIRQSSTESGARTLKGTTGGAGMKFNIRSMFCMSSIQVGIKHDADHDRIALLRLKSKRDNGGADAWEPLKEALYTLRRDPEISAKLMRRSLVMLPTTLRNIDGFAKGVAKQMGSQREGDQYGTLLAGAWSLIRGTVASEDDVAKIVGRYDWSQYVEHTETDDSQKALAALLGAMIRTPKNDAVTVYELVCRAARRAVEGFEMDPRQAETILRRHGIGIAFEVTGHQLLVSPNSLELLKLLAGTPYAADVKGQLLRIAGATRYAKLVSFNGNKDRAVALPLDPILASEPRAELGYEPGMELDAPF